MATSYIVHFCLLCQIPTLINPSYYNSSGVPLLSQVPHVVGEEREKEKERLTQGASQPQSKEKTSHNLDKKFV